MRKYQGAHEEPEQDIVAKNLYGPNGVQVSNFIRSIKEGREDLLTEIEQAGLMRHYNRAMEDVLNAVEEEFSQYMKEGPYVETPSWYEDLQGMFLTILEKLILDK